MKIISVVLLMWLLTQMEIFLFLMGKNNLLLHLELTIIVVRKIEQDDCVIIQQNVRIFVTLNNLELCGKMSGGRVFLNAPLNMAKICISEDICFVWKTNPKASWPYVSIVSIC